MRLRHLLALAATLWLSSAPAPAQQRARSASPEMWRHWAWVCRNAVRPLDGGAPALSPTVPGRDCFDEPVRRLLVPEDIPADLRRRRFQGTTHMEVDVSPDGTATGCTLARPSGEPRLDRLACSLVSSRARLRPLYAAPRRRIAARHELSAEWEITDTPPPVYFAPPALAMAPVVDYNRYVWPRLDWWWPLELVALPRIQNSYPAAARRGGVVSLDLRVRAETGIKSCQIGVSSGDAALDDAACRVARTVELRYPRPCEQCPDTILPLQVVWARAGGSHIRFPLPFGRNAQAPLMDPADTRRPDARRALPVGIPYAISVADYRRIEDRTMTNRRFVADVAIDVDGRPTSCRTRRSTGNPAVDRRSCEIILQRARYRPQTDVFGNPAATPTRSHTMDLPPLD